MKTRTKYLTALKIGSVPALLLFTEIVRADPLDTWTWRNPLPTGDDLNGIAYGNGQFVAVGGGNAMGLYEITILTSSNGVSWVQRQSASSSGDHWLNAIVHIGGVRAPRAFLRLIDTVAPDLWHRP